MIKQFLITGFFFFSPVVKYGVVGKSMTPTYKPGDDVLVIKKYYCRISRGDVIAFSDPRTKSLLIKRVITIDSKGYYVVGDNQEQSTDSRTFGSVTRSTVIGKVFYHIQKT